MADRPKLSARPAPRDPNRRPVRPVRPGVPPRPAPAKTEQREQREQWSQPAPERGAPRQAPGRPASPRPAPPSSWPRPAPPRPAPPRPAPPRPAQTRPAAPKPAAPPATEGVRISKLITERGIASRREADEWIEAGWVRVDGRLAVLGQRAAPDARIDIDPKARNEQARRVTVLLNKPIGYVSGQAEDGHEPASVLVTPATRWAHDASGIHFDRGHLRHLAPAGRLDIDSTGLLVLTQDGRVAKRLIGDETRVEKEYLVRVEQLQPGPPPEHQLQRLRHGLELDGQPLKPAQVSWSNEDQLRVVLREGKKRQIRRMCELVGLKVTGLKRVRIGSVVLGALPVGQWRYLGDHERF